jgi:hypothetical protein
MWAIYYMLTDVLRLGPHLYRTAPLVLRRHPRTGAIYYDLEEDLNLPQFLDVSLKTSSDL